MADDHTTSPRFHVEGQTSTQGARWQIWDNAPGKHYARFRNIADKGDADELCRALNTRQPQSPADEVERIGAIIESFVLGRIGSQVCRNAAKEVLSAIRNTPQAIEATIAACREALGGLSELEEQKLRTALSTQGEGR